MTERIVVECVNSAETEQWVEAVKYCRERIIIEKSGLDRRSTNEKQKDPQVLQMIAADIECTRYVM